MSADPIGFMAEDDFAGIEHTTGIAGQDQTIPGQWALLSIEDATSNRHPAGKKAMRLRLRLKADAVMALTPKKTAFVDVWMSGKNQGFVDGLCVSVGLTPMTHRFGEATGPNDRRPLMEGNVAEMAGDTLARTLKGRSFIGMIAVESKEGMPDRNVLNGIHRISDENLAAIRGAGFSGAKGAVKVKTRDEGGKKKSYLTVGTVTTSTTPTTAAVID